LSYYQDAIHYEEAADNLYGAAKTRYNVAVALARARRFADARQYAVAAKRGFEQCPAAADKVQETTQLLSVAQRSEDSQW
jgi:hypothetical protein